MQVRDRIQSTLSTLTRPFKWQGMPPRKNEKLRVLYIVGEYPKFSETYMHEEMLSVADQVHLKIVTHIVAEQPHRAKHLPYELIEYPEERDLHWGNFDRINTSFSNKVQRQFLKSVGVIIKQYRPHVMHGHYFATGLILRHISDIYKVPFTLRTHSFDMLRRRPNDITALFEALKSPRCLAIFTFPEFAGTFIRHGIPRDRIIPSWPVVCVKRFLHSDMPPATGRILCCGVCTTKKAHTAFIDLAERMRGSRFEFNLYSLGNEIDSVRRYNESKGNPVTISYSDPEAMAAVYRKHDWLVYPSDTDMNEVGLPVSIVEAQASGIGVCWQELPGRRAAQLDFMGGAGYLFKSIDEVPQIIQHGLSDDMRLRGYENAKKCDADLHGQRLTAVWNHLR